MYHSIFHFSRSLSVCFVSFALEIFHSFHVITTPLHQWPPSAVFDAVWCDVLPPKTKKPPRGAHTANLYIFSFAQSRGRWGVLGPIAFMRLFRCFASQSEHTGS